MTACARQRHGGGGLARGRGRERLGRAVGAAHAAAGRGVRGAAGGHAARARGAALLQRARGRARALRRRQARRASAQPQGSDRAFSVVQGVLRGARALCTDLLCLLQMSITMQTNRRRGRHCVQMLGRCTRCPGRVCIVPGPASDALSAGLCSNGRTDLWAHRQLGIMGDKHCLACTSSISLVWLHDPVLPRIQCTFRDYQHAHHLAP